MAGCTRFSFAGWVSMAVVIVFAGCGGGGGGGEGGVARVTITGTLNGANGAALADSALASTVAVVGVNEEGVVADAVVTADAFTLDLSTGHDYCLCVRDRTVAGATRAVLVVREGGAAGPWRGDFSLSPESPAEIDVGRVSVGVDGLAVSTLDLAELLPPATGRYPDTDRDYIPDPMDRDDDGDGVRDGDDCRPLDALLSVTLTTGGCVANDEDDDNDGVADVADGYRLDPTEQVDSDGDGIGDTADSDDDGDGILDLNDPDPPAEVARLMALLGEWDFTYRIISTFTDTYDLTLVERGDNGLFVSGADPYGKLVLADVAADPVLGYDYLLFADGAIIGQAYFFNVSADSAAGEYWQTDPVTNEIISLPYALRGLRVAPADAVVAHAVADPAAVEGAQIGRASEAAADGGATPTLAKEGAGATAAIRSILSKAPALLRRAGR